MSEEIPIVITQLQKIIIAKLMCTTRNFKPFKNEGFYFNYVFRKRKYFSENIQVSLEREKNNASKVLRDMFIK